MKDGLCTDWLVAYEAVLAEEEIQSELLQCVLVCFDPPVDVANT